MALLFLAKIYCLRAVVAACVAALLLFISVHWEIPRWIVQDWLSLGLAFFILVHHLLMSLNMDFLHGLLDIPFLLFEITGLSLYVHFTAWEFRVSLPSSTIHLVVFCILSTFLSLEVLLRMGLLVSIILPLPVPYRYSSMPDLTSEERLKPYQIIFGRSLTGLRYNGNTPNVKMLGGFFRQVKIMLLRVVLTSSFISLALFPFVWHDIGLADKLWFTLLLLIVLHHLVSSINLQFDYVFADLPFLLFEITAITPYFDLLPWFNNGSLNPFSTTVSSSLVCYVLFFSAVFIGLVLETLIWAIYVITYMMHLVQRVRNPAYGTSDFTGANVIAKPQDVLFGSSLWKKHVTGETWIMTISRGVLVMIFIFVLFFSSIIDIVISPVQETGAIPVKDMRSPDARRKHAVNVWNFVFIHQNSNTELPNMTEWDSRFQSAVKVTQLSDSGLIWLNGGFVGGPLDSGLNSASPCVYAAGFSYPENPTYYFSNIGGEFVPELLLVYQISTIYCDSGSQNFLITVNFTTLQIPVGTINSTSSSSLQIMVGLNNDTQKVIERTTGTTLIPGTNLFGTVTWNYRQVLKHPSLSAFGLFDSYDTIMVSRMLSVISDPAESPLIPRSPDIATFRLLMQSDISELRTVQDYRTRSILQGFSAVGGLWTFLSGIFAAIFGSSILRILFGGKPISFTGLAHSMQRNKIQKAWEKKYPEIERQIRQAGFEGGLVSLLLDEVIDLEFLGVKKRGDDSITPPDNADTSTSSGDRINLQDMDRVEQN